MAPCKCLILLALLLCFFFFFTTANATGNQLNSFKEKPFKTDFKVKFWWITDCWFDVAERSFGVMESNQYESAEKGHDSKFKPSEDGVLPEPEEIGDLAEMDYTPPRKKPPIHNWNGVGFWRKKNDKKLWSV